MLRILRKSLILLHRYLGILLCLLFVMWFLSGIVMIYAKGMPEISAKSRLEHLPPLDLASIQITPSDAATRAGIDGPSPRLTLLTLQGRPAYRFATSRMETVFADSGELMVPPNPEVAATIAGRYLNIPESAIRFDHTLNEADQWTIGNRRILPLHKFNLDDAAGTEIYVSGRSAEVGMVTTRNSRALAWISAIPHWMYLESLRLNNSLWQSVVLWTSGVGTIVAAMGILLAILQYSRRPPHIRYAGWMRWHYITGAIFGVFTLTWVFSGFLSMEPWDWASEGGLGDGMTEAFRGGSLDLSQFPAVKAAEWRQVLSGKSIKEVEFLRIQENPYYAVRGDAFDPILVAAQPLQVHSDPFSADSLIARAREANPDIPIVDTQELPHYDSYYYSRGDEATLPVLRVKFGDPDQTWFYIDRHMGQIVARYQRRERLQRWIYHGLHSLDFSFWYYNRPLWDIGVIALCSGGAMLSTIGVVISVRRLRRDFRKVLR